MITKERAVEILSMRGMRKGLTEFYAELLLYSTINELNILQNFITDLKGFKVDALYERKEEE